MPDSTIRHLVRPEQLALAFTLLIMLGGVDEQHIVWLLALLKHQDAHRDACGEEQVRGQANHRIDVSVFQQLGTDTRFGTSSEQHTVGQDDRHHTVLLQEMEAM